MGDTTSWSNQILDGHRQNLLEKANYKFIRIWSTDWWQNYEGAKIILFSKINEILDTYSANQIEPIQWLNNLILTSELSNESLNDFHDDVESVEVDDNDENEIITQDTTITRVISRSCSVRLRLNGTEELFFRISDYTTFTRNGEDLNASSPLARLLLGKTVGDSVQFNNHSYLVLEII